MGIMVHVSTEAILTTTHTIYFIFGLLSALYIIMYCLFWIFYACTQRASSEYEPIESKSKMEEFGLEVVVGVGDENNDEDQKCDDEKEKEHTIMLPMIIEKVEEIRN